MGFKLLKTTYKYNKESYTNCPIFKEDCQFTPEFIEGCRQGRTMMGCNKCKENNPIILLTCDKCGDEQSFNNLDEAKQLSWSIFREDDVKCNCPNCNSSNI